MPRLVVERGSEKGASLRLDGPQPVVVGRLTSCDLVLTDSLASRRHFTIAQKGEHFKVSDLSSHNGTYVNGQRIEAETVLRYGSTIRAGETLLAFLSDSDVDEGALAGKKIGGYHLLQRIGVGGMGEVYKAVQMSLGRQVALKILSPELTKDRAFVEKFLCEARAAGKFNHPNVIQVHESGEEKGFYYFSMEFVDGGSVQDLISGGRKLPALRATELILQSSRALEYAQKVGIVHCDIKPDNLMLTSSGEVRLADLGIAKTLNEKGKAEQSDGVFGSPHFMAPEQARGLPLDHRSDLYSLGVTYYRIILGRVPFNGKDAREIMEKQVYEEPESSKKLDPDLPPAVHAILQKLLRKKPIERYQSAAQLSADLEQALDQIHKGVKAPASVPTATNRVPSKRQKPRNSGFWGAS